MRTLLVVAAATAVITGAAACTADPPPPIQSTETATSTPAAAVPTGNPVVVAIDDVGNGFNPHLLADQSPANVAVGALVLPSPFRAAASVSGDTEWLLDQSLVSSAEVTSQDPFTVTYQLRNESQWSDGAPIAAEDFRYLWQQMISAPGVVDPAGYALIADVRSSGGGKTVDVIMDSPYPAWRELFANLLPSHLLKDSPGGFERGLREDVPVSGGQFRIKTIDRGRDEILLERNDRFWGAPAAPDQILLRRGGSTAQLADSMRSGDAQVAQVRGGPAVEAQLDAIPDVRTDTRFQPRSLELVLNGRVPELASLDVRRGLMGLLDANLLATVGAGTVAAGTPARAQVRAPSDPGYLATAPAPIGRDRALESLAAAGYVPGGALSAPVVPSASSAPSASGAPSTPPSSTPPSSAATSSTLPSTSRAPASVAPLGRDGEPLSLVIGTAEDDEIATAVANTAADELRAAGVDATVTPLDPEELYGSALTSGEVGAIVGWSRVGTDPATAMASRFGCLPAAPVPDADAVAGDSGRDNAGNDDGNDNDQNGGSNDDSDRPPPAPVVLSNLAGVCDPTLQPALDGALRGSEPADRVAADAESRLWALAAFLPIMQDSSIVAAGPTVSGVSLTGPIENGVFADAPVWLRQGR